MRIVKEIEVNMPDWAIPYLANGEDDSLDEADIELIETWLKAMHMDGFVSPTFDFDFESEHNGFYWHPEFGLGAPCVYTHVYQFEV